MALNLASPEGEGRVRGFKIYQALVSTVKIKLLIRIKVFPDRQGGIAWNHKSGGRQYFFLNQKNGPTISDQERELIRVEQRRREVERKQGQDRAAKKLLKIWNLAVQAPPDLPQLVRKDIKPHGARTCLWERFFYNDRNQRHKLQIENCLLLPIFNESGVIRDLQAIFPAESPELGRSKDFFLGAELTGLFWWIDARSNPICVAEGISTDATLHEETGYRVYVAYVANNLKNVGKIVRQNLPDSEIIFCADNDENTTGNPGVTKANQTTAEVGAMLLFHWYQAISSTSRPTCKELKEMSKDKPVSECRNCGIGIHTQFRKQAYCSSCIRWVQVRNLAKATKLLMDQLKAGV